MSAVPAQAGTESRALLWRCVHFDELTAREAHDIYQLRAEVFVVEQACAFQDLDGADPVCWHLMGIAGDALGPGLRRGDEPADKPRLVAYARLVPPGAKYAEPSIGRVMTDGPSRGTGLGKELMRRALEWAEKLWPDATIRIGAQSRLERFYNDLGFVTASGEYLEDGIPHIEMLRGPAARGRNG